MGFVFRKSFKIGPFRITVSKSGISFSAGVKGARVTNRADGRMQTTGQVMRDDRVKARVCTVLAPDGQRAPRQP